MIEQLYNDFTTKLLPKIAEGLVISKDYFTDLFGRYIKYLIITDSFVVLVCLAVIIILPIVICKNREWIIKETGGVLFILLIFLIIPIFQIFISSSNLIKDIYIPEIRIYEELKGFIK